MGEASLYFVWVCFLFLFLLFIADRFPLKVSLTMRRSPSLISASGGGAGPTFFRIDTVVFPFYFLP